MSESYVYKNMRGMQPLESEILSKIFIEVIGRTAAAIASTDLP